MMEQEAKVNLHKSGLKMDLESAPPTDSTPSPAAVPVEAAKDEESPPKKKGWRKYILFGPRRES